MCVLNNAGHLKLTLCKHDRETFQVCISHTSRTELRCCTQLIVLYNREKFGFISRYLQALYFDPRGIGIKGSIMS